MVFSVREKLFVVKVLILIFVYFMHKNTVGKHVITSGNQLQ